MILAEAYHRNAQEANTRRVRLNEQDPASVDLALKHIYGGGEHLHTHQKCYRMLTQGTRA